MQYTVKQLSSLAGVGRRTLHYYDQLGLLKPDAIGTNGYRYYGEAALLRLQQILFFKELDFSLTDIRDTIHSPGFDTLQALRAHRQSLQERLRRLARLIETVDKTILHLNGELEMPKKEYYAGFSEAKQRGYEEEIRQRYGSKELDESRKRWGGFSSGQKAAVQDDFGRIATSLRDVRATGPDSPESQALVAQLHAWVNNFYDCSIEVFEGLGHMYREHPDFRTMYETNYGAGFPEYLGEAIDFYCAGPRGGVAPG